jgi:16S rRNA (guanine(966)-N(2))-methyltransferase RsmD
MQNKQNNNHNKNSDKELYVQIQGGIYKGKKIFLPPKTTTRITKSILKQSFFNVIRGDIYNSIFIEAFGGSGSVGLEAISQGAKKTYFIEYNYKAFLALKQNCEFLKDYEYEIHNKDSFTFLDELVKNIYSSKDIDKENSNLILYIDPPFSTDDNKTYDKCIKMLKKINEIQNKKNVLIVFERQTSFLLDESIGNFKLVKTSKFGNSSLSYYSNCIN